MDIKINILEVASELADRDLQIEFDFDESLIYHDDGEVCIYTDEAQDMFNDLYDYYYDFLLSFADKTELKAWTEDLKS